MSTGRSNLLVNGYGTSIPFYAIGKYLYQKLPWPTTANYVEEYFDITANGSTHTRGSHSVIEIDRRGDLMQDAYLHFARALFASGTNMEAVDWEGAMSIEKIVVMYNNKQVYTVRGEKLVLDYLEKTSTQERESEARLCLGDMSVSDRKASALIAQSDIWVNLRFPWRKINKTVDMVGLPNKIRVEIYWKPIAEVCKSTSGAVTGGAISDVYLRTKFIHLPESQRIQNFNKTQSETGVRVKMLSFEEHRRVSHTVTGSTASSTRFELRNIRNDVVIIRSLVRWNDNVTNFLFLNPLNFLAHKLQINDNGSNVTKEFNYYEETTSHETTPAFHKFKETSEMFPTQEVGMNIGKIAFCSNKLVGASEDGCYGSRNIGRYNNPEIVVSWDASEITSTGSPAGNGNLLIDVIADVHNILLTKKGDWRTYLL